MLALVVTLILIGVLLYLAEQIPMDPAIRTIIRVVVVVCVVLYVIEAFGFVDMPLPRLRH